MEALQSRFDTVEKALAQCIKEETKDVASEDRRVPPAGTPGGVTEGGMPAPPDHLRRAPPTDATRDERRGQTRRLYFGTVGEAIIGLGQHREHEMITRTALDCDAGPENRAFAQKGLCFQSYSLDLIAGHLGSFGAVGAPDNPDNNELERSEAHCDNSKVLECRDYVDAQMNAAVAAAGDLLCPKDKDGCPEGALDIEEIPTGMGVTGSPTNLECTYTRHASLEPDRAKCDVLEHLGSMLHAVQDFYSHSNWADEAAPGPTSVSNPEGLNQKGPAPFLNIREPRADAHTPKGLITGCYFLPGKGTCTVPSHDDLNKDDGIIEPALFNQPNDPTLTTATTKRGKIGTNFHKAVEAAVLDTRDKILVFRERLNKAYGNEKGALLFCAITNDDPTGCSSRI
jgi:hypothetical protein